ncbi:MAG: hypothetical protein RLZZ445_1469 [Pseudomonadota bacterium]|jgi:hypothetical protein
MFEVQPEIVIQDITVSGETFRPNDWAERLSGMLSVLSDDGYLACSPFLKPIMTRGVRYVAIDREL